jgi:hypothetical protein
MKQEIEYEYAENCWLCGNIELVDGLLKVTDFQVIVWINDLDYDITKGLSKSNLDSFKESFSEYAIFKNIGEAEGVMSWE